MPTIDVSELKIMTARRKLGTKVAMTEPKMRKTSCATPRGIWIRSALISEKAKPAMTMPEN
jgi:hypothetical protein